MYNFFTKKIITDLTDKKKYVNKCRDNKDINYKTIDK